MERTTMTTNQTMFTDSIPSYLAGCFDSEMNAYVIVGEDFDYMHIAIKFPEIDEDGDLTVRVGVAMAMIKGEAIKLSQPNEKVEWFNLLSRKIDIYELLESGFLSQADAEAVLAWAIEHEGEPKSFTLKPNGADAALFFNLREVMKPQADGTVVPAANPIGIDQYCLQSFKIQRSNGGFNAAWSTKNTPLKLRKVEVEVEEEVTI